MPKYQVNFRCDEKDLHELTDAELDQVINRCPIQYSGASSIASRMVSWEIWDELSRRAKLRRANLFQPI